MVKKYLKPLSVHFRALMSVRVRAFTLVELLVSVGIIVILMVSAVGIYVYSINSQQRTMVITNLQEDGQLILDLIAKDTRTNNVDYGYWSDQNRCPPLPSQCTVLTDGTTRIIYRQSCLNVSCVLQRYEGPWCASRNCDGDTGDTIEDCDDDMIGTTTFQTINMTDVNIDKFDVYTSPECDPFGDRETYYRVPQTTIVLKLTSNRYRAKIGTYSLLLQQTVPQRFQEKSVY
jgi:type II secretory pathway pseudopilin PulG